MKTIYIYKVTQKFYIVCDFNGLSGDLSACELELD